MSKTNVEYIVDENGRKKSVVMSYRAYLKLMEDLADLAAIAERRNEKTVPLDDVVAELRRTKQIQGKQDGLQPIHR